MYVMPTQPILVSVFLKKYFNPLPSQMTSTFAKHELVKEGMCSSVNNRELSQLRGELLMYLKFKLFLKGKEIIRKACRSSEFACANKCKKTTQLQCKVCQNLL